MPALLPPLDLRPGPHRTLAPDFLSFTLDTSLVLGGRWWGPSRRVRRGVAVDTVAPLDLADPVLVARAAALAPALLRIGGTEADRVRYHLAKGPAPGGAHEYQLTRPVWKGILKFLRRSGLELVFTLGAGPADRHPDGSWNEAGARALIERTLAKGGAVVAWELGNEVNGFPFVHGLGSGVSSARYSEDFRTLGRLLADLAPGARAVGPASAVWPKIGEPNPLIPGLCRGVGAPWVGAVTWHYYPQQSHHGPVATRRVGKTTMLSPRRLDGVLRWVRMVDRARAEVGRPGVESWVTETAHALYGGEPGLSDTFASTLWWLDELGLLAREGVHKVFRQALVGARYGLLDQDTREPRPDYWASFLWKKLMGPLVHPSPAPGRWPARLRVYRHSWPGTPDRTTLLLINLDPRRLRVLAPPGRVRELWCLEGADGLTSRVLHLNGHPADDGLVTDWGRPRLRRRYGAGPRSGPLVLPPLSAVFVVLEPNSHGELTGNPSSGA